MFVEKSKLADQLLKPLEGFLARAGFVGCVDVSAIIDEDGHPWPLEFTTRGGWPALNLEAACFDGDFVEFFHGLAQGKPPDRVHRLHEVVCGIVLALPDFPYSHVTRKEVVGVPIYGVDQRLLPHLHFAQVAKGEAPQKRDDRIDTAPMYVSAGDYVAVLTGVGNTVVEARRKAYSAIRSINMPSGAFYRNDIGQRLKHDIPKLQKFGYCPGISYA